MGKFYRSIGAFAAKMASKEGLASGFMDALDVKPIATAINENQELLSRLIADLEPRALALAINENPGFLPALLNEFNAEPLPDILIQTVNALLGKLREANQLESETSAA